MIGKQVTLTYGAYKGIRGEIVAKDENGFFKIKFLDTCMWFRREEFRLKAAFKEAAKSLF